MKKVVCFHNPEEEYGWLSNWYPSKFRIDGNTFSSMEQFMMFSKAKVFNDEIIAAKILGSNDPASIKALGRLVSNYDEILWNGFRQIIVYNGLMAKFSQNSDLKSKLLQTGESILAECAVKDRIWGIGLSLSDKNRFNLDLWKGQNLLGFSLMMVRDAVKNV